MAWTKVKIKETKVENEVSMISEEQGVELWKDGEEILVYKNVTF